MIVVLLSVMNRRTASRGSVAARGAMSANSTAPTTVIEPIATKAASAISFSSISNPACAIDAEAARVSARFFGFAAESSRPRPNRRGDPDGWSRDSVLLLALIFGGAGLFVEGLIWLLAIAAILVIAGAVIGFRGSSGSRV